MKQLKRIPHLEWFPLIALSLLTYHFIKYIPAVSNWFGQLGGALLPFVWAFIIAYFLNPAIKFFESKGLKRMQAMACTYLTFIGVFILILMLVVPILVINIQEIATSTPAYLEKIDLFIQNNVDKYEGITKIDYEKYIDFSNPQKLLDEVAKYFDLFSNLILGLVGFTTGLIKFLLGLIISVYLLADLEGFSKSAYRGLVAITSEEKASRMIALLKEIDLVFGKYFVGQAIDSVLVAAIAFVGFSLIGVPYSVLMALIIGVTNMIPYFGPIIGLVPVVLITLFVNPLLALYAFVFIIALQQIDGYVIAPRIVGSAVGITPFWSIMAILVGGSQFGVVGMIACVPVFAVMRNQARKWIDWRLSQKNKETQENVEA